MRGKNDKITMHKSSLARKRDYAAKYRDAQVHTVVFDERTGHIYNKAELGSFQQEKLDKVTLDDLNLIIK